MTRRLVHLLACTLLGLGMGCGKSSDSQPQAPVEQGSAAGGPGQRALDQLARSLEVKVAVVQNPSAASSCPDTAPWGLCVDATITLTNTGPAFAAGQGWSLYFSAIRKVLTLDSDEFTFAHVN